MTLTTFALLTNFLANNIWSRCFTHGQVI